MSPSSDNNEGGTGKRLWEVTVATVAKATVVTAAEADGGDAGPVVNTTTFARMVTFHAVESFADFTALSI